MPDILSLRARALALVDRKAEVARHVAALRAVTFVPTRAMVDAQFEEVEWDHVDEVEMFALRGHPLGEPIPVFSDPGLFVATGAPKLDDRYGHDARDALWILRELERLSAWVPDVTVGDEPSLDGMTPFEVSAVVGAYVSAIGRLTNELRDADARVRKLSDKRMAMPSHAKARCLGMFGGPDFPTRFRYEAGDFDRYNRTWVTRPRADPDDRRGPTESVLVDHHPRLMSARYLAPMTGDEAALSVEATLGLLREATAPRPGEPPTRDYDGNDGRNVIEVSYAPGEIDVVAAPTPPAP